MGAECNFLIIGGGESRCGGGGCDTGGRGGVNRRHWTTIRYLNEHFQKKIPD
jgi:hypothetical protein